MDQRTISKLALLILLAGLTFGAVGMAALNVHFTHGGTETLALGRAAEKRGQHDEAISLFTKAIESKDLSADETVIAYVRRGFSYALAGDLQRAINDFDEAIHLNPESPLGYGGRGMIRITTRKCDLAVDDLSKAIEKDRNYAPAYFSRGFCHFIKREYSEAARDFQRELVLKPSDAYGVLWRHVTRAKLGIPDREELTANASAIDLTRWPGPVVAFYLGKTSDEELKNIVQSTDSTTRTKEECEGNFFLGEDQLFRGHEDAAMGELQRASAVCPLDFYEQAAAVSELRQ